MLILYLACIGLVMGSFLCCAICRKDDLKSMNGRSHCDSCGKVLSWYELIPIVSYLLQCGKCRACKAKIPLWTLASEIMCCVTFIMFALMDWKYATILFLLFLSSLFDFQYGEVPSWLTTGALAFAAISALLTVGYKGVLAGSCMFIIFYVVYQIRPEAIGGADILLISASLMFYSFMDIPMYLLMISGTALVYMTLRKSQGIKLIPVLWLVYVIQYWITL